MALVLIVVQELTAKKQIMLEGNAKYQERANTLTGEIRRILLSYSALDQTLPYNICGPVVLEQYRFDDVLFRFQFTLIPYIKG